MKKSAIALMLLTAALAAGSQSPKSKPQTVTLEQRLQLTEEKMAKLAASHDKTMTRMKQIEGHMDKLIEAIRAFREKLK